MSNWKVGDTVMLVSTAVHGRTIRVTKDKIKAIHKNGLILLEGTDQKYRENGTPTGERPRWHDDRPRLKAWDDALWQRAQIVAEQAGMASNLHTLGEFMQRLAVKDRAKAAEIWESLPFPVRDLIARKGDEA